MHVELFLILAGLISTNSKDAFPAELSPAQIYKTTAPAVVLILAVGSEGVASGTGSIIDSKGLILTNAHVILDDKANAPAEKIFVFLKPERVIGAGDNKANLQKGHAATVVGYQKALDLALLKMSDAATPLPTLQLGDPDSISIGSKVAAIGHPEKGGLWTLTTGVISAEWQDFSGVPGKDIFQTETSLNRGNSGGPLIDVNGYQVGVNSSGYKVSEDGLPISSINFAIKSSVVKDWLGRQGVQVAYAAQASPALTERSGGGDTISHGDKSREDEKKVAAPRAKVQPAKVLENQPEAEPETGPGLPPLRPFSLDGLIRDLNLVQKDLESQMDDMAAELRKRRR